MKNLIAIFKLTDSWGNRSMLKVYRQRTEVSTEVTYQLSATTPEHLSNLGPDTDRLPRLVNRAVADTHIIESVESYLNHTSYRTVADCITAEAALYGEAEDEPSRWDDFTDNELNQIVVALRNRAHEYSENIQKGLAITRRVQRNRAVTSKLLAEARSAVDARR